MKDLGVVMAIADRLPVLVQQEQVAAHKESQLAPKAPRAAAQEQRRINPHLLRDRDMVCKAFETHAKDRGWDGDGKKPNGALKTFAARFRWPPGWKPRKQAQALGKWWRIWTTASRRGDDERPGPKQRRSGGAGARRKCPWLSSALYEWWSHMRYSIDWERVTTGEPEEKRHRNIARYTQAPSSVRPPRSPPPN